MRLPSSVVSPFRPFVGSPFRRFVIPAFLIEQVNREGKHGFQFDYTYDAVGNLANYYCRSDHYMYARFGIPIAFFSTGAHEDYHQVTDEVQYIDFEKMARVVGLVEASTLAVANLDSSGGGGQAQAGSQGTL